MSNDDSFERALDLIRRVQDARMAHDAEAIPSQVSAVYWIEAKARTPGTHPTARAGYWLVETTLQAVDRVWQVVKTATVEGRLGYKSKVATASRSGDPDARVIHVCTYDAADAGDVARVEAALRALELQPVAYHADE